MAIIGTHMLFYSAEADALRATLRDAFGFTSVDAGGGWLIFAPTPAELGVHPADGPADHHHQITFMCDDIHATVADLRAKGIHIDGDPKAERFGIIALMTLPGGVRVMLYEPRHALAINPG